ncbi:MAG: sensor histidine kinase [Nannocystaceae bacterium]|nr:PAS domain-containing sensor histidine kinase [bacterium]
MGTATRGQWAAGGPHFDLGAFEDLANSIPVGITIARWEDRSDRVKFRYVWVNDHALSLARAHDSAPIEQFLGKTLDEAFPELVESEVPDKYVAAMQTGQSQVIAVLPYAGESYEIRVAPMSTDLIVVTYVNVRDRVRAEQARDSLVEELRRSNEELDQFAHIAAHDLKAPLRNLASLAGWVAEDLPAEQLPDGTRRHLELMKSVVRRMENLLDDLMLYARAGRGEPEPSRFTMAALVDSVRGSCGLQPGFELVVPEAPLLLTAIRTPLELVLRNLISNAARHHDRPAGRIELSFDAPGDDILSFSVADDGPGIPQEHHGRAFEMFTRLQPSEDGGTGAGLALVKKTVEARGGAVTLQSQGRGTTVHFTWPGSVHAQ